MLEESSPDGLIAAARRRRAAPCVARRESLTAVVSAVLFVFAAVPLALLPATSRVLSWPVLALLVGLYAVASLVEFEVGAGSAVATQLVLVPMLFLLPTGVVPLAACAGYVLGDLARWGARRTAPARPVVLIGSSWYAIGPAVVLLATGEQAPSWERWPLYLLAFAAQFGFDLTSTLIADAAAYGVRPALSLRVIAWVYLIDVLLAPIGAALAFIAYVRPWAALLALPLLALLVVFARDRKARIDSIEDLGKAYRGTAMVLGDVIGFDDGYTGDHSRSVVWLSLAVAEGLGLDEATRRDVEFTALLHDVGKLRVPKEIINKPGPLSPAERAVVETHTVEGERLLGGIGGFLGRIGSLVRSCHERHDGGGYPDGLVGEAIPVVARIVFCCDAFDAITTDRPYRAARSWQEAIAEIQAGSGSQFAPEVVVALEAAVTDALAANRDALRPAAEAPTPVSNAVRDRAHVEELRQRSGVAGFATDALIGGGFAIVATALAAFVDPGVLDGRLLAIATGLVLAYAIAYGIEFKIGPGSAVPTQLVLIPMLVFAPPELTPLIVGVAITLRTTIDRVRTRAAGRTFAPLASAWYCVGPAIVVATAGAGGFDWPMLAVAFGLQVLLDAAVNVMRVHVVLGFPFGPLVRSLAWAYLVDAALTPVAYALVVPAESGAIASTLAVVALVGFLAVLAADRNRQVVRAADLTDAYLDAADRARRDPLTGLRNRLAWDETIAALPSEEPVAVLLLDVDGLKVANDTRGHAFGDALLMLVARLLADAAPQARVAARIGGDEFVALFVGDDATSAHDSAHLLRHLLSSHERLDGFPVSAAIGFASRPPATDIPAMLVEADAAAYREKAARPARRDVA